MSSIEEVDNALDLEPPLNTSLNRIGSIFAFDTERSSTSTTVESNFGSLASVGRFCNDADDIIYHDGTEPEGTQYKLAGSTTVADGSSRDSPVYVPWILSKERHVEVDNERPCLDEAIDKQIIVQRVGNNGSSLAPQSSNASTISSTPSIRREQRHRTTYAANLAAVQQIRFPDAIRNTDQATNRPVTTQISFQPSHLTTPRQPGADPLQCGECGKSFHRRSDLIHHTRYHIRSSDRPYKCDECGHGFLHKKDLDRHMPRHTGQKLFHCSVPGCTKTYTRKDNLSRHIRHDHATGSSLLTAPIADELSAAESGDFSDHSVGQPVVRHSTHRSRENSAPGTEEVGTPSASDGYQLIEANEPRPSNNGKRPADDDLLNGRGAAKRPPRKSPLKHRLACPYRKCDPLQFSSHLHPRYKVCATTPHEYMRRVVDHMDRNHQMSVCGKCFLGFSSAEYLQKHKDNSEHCSKCYLPFPTQDALSAHQVSCRPVESSGSQEDVWQIMYETLCGDEIRHDPSFDNDSKPEESIPSNNLARMRFLAQQTPLPGQVEPLNQASSKSAGNGSAPSTDSDSHGNPQKGTAVVGARNKSLFGADLSRHVQQLQSETRQLHVREPRYRPVAMLSGQLPIQQHVEVQDAYELLDTKEIAQPFDLSVYQYTDHTNWDSGYLSVGGSGISVAPLSRSVFATRDKGIPSIKLESSFSRMDDIFPMLPLDRFDQRCPSLTSESTIPTQHQLGTAENTFSYSPICGGDDLNHAVKQEKQSYQHIWNQSPSLEQHSSFAAEFAQDEEHHAGEEVPLQYEPRCAGCRGRHSAFHFDGLCLQCFAPWQDLNAP